MKYWDLLWIMRKDQGHMYTQTTIIMAGWNKILQIREAFVV